MGQVRLVTCSYPDHAHDQYLHVLLHFRHGLPTTMVGQVSKSAVVNDDGNIFSRSTAATQGASQGAELLDKMCIYLR